ncbi:hypothetical protein [Prescottella subtropica]|uniref:hypothetical protein n=1 Tax=Prescottella subtropica TaxID=2545757 RepID=UPI0010F96A58|nr:hypothetical protein [Prescottella subtropica]
MSTATITPAGLVTEKNIPAFGPYAATPVSPETVAEQVTASTAEVAQPVDGQHAAADVAALITNRIGAGFGAVAGTVFTTHHGHTFAMAGVIVGVNEVVVQFADENKNLHVVPLASAVAVILD